MFEALVITLREGVEAALVLAIAVAALGRRGLSHLKSALFAGAALAVVASVGAAWLATRIPYDEELAEGIAMLVGAVLVLTLVIWMWVGAARLREEIERGVERATVRGAGFGSAAGIFLFAFGMVFREGAETAIFLSAASFNSAGLGMWLGAALGLVLAVVFGVMFVRGALRVPLGPFFSLTSAVLLLIAAQLVVGGLHELSEAGVLPASKAEMAIVGPIIKNELLLFALTVALAAGWLLFGPGRPATAGASESGPEARLERAARAREAAQRRGIGIVGLIVVAFLTIAFVRTSRVPGRPPAQPASLRGGVVTLDAAGLGDGHAHFFETSLGEHKIRFFAIQFDGKLRTCFDACEICGDIGYFESGDAMVCRNCTSPIAPKSLGRIGGCNPIPITHRLDGGIVTLDSTEFARVLPELGGR